MQSNKRINESLDAMRINTPRTYAKMMEMAAANKKYNDSKRVCENQEEIYIWHFKIQQIIAEYRYLEDLRL